MTQAFNLAQFANNLNTAGATSNAGLQNSAVTVTAGTGMSGGGSVALGSSVTLTNAGVTSVTAGSGISVSASTGGVTISAAGGGVTSLNGQTGAITNTSLDNIGSVVSAVHAVTTTYNQNNVVSANCGDTLAGSVLRRNFNSTQQPFPFPTTNTSSAGGQVSIAYNQGGIALSGTWRLMARAVGSFNVDNGCGGSVAYWYPSLFVRVS